ncbi:MAG: pyruvate kinase [Candidatus Absconditabacteria bacterium]|nr:pyruvate kinase [Candidatus Absconditabacteria bacterium]MDD3868279.1 pyruvate kinase [Candidatus Absconditabacteria bacterium]MDD4714593.1 pyruvate kinase [Candidatus Absconditabacteria bacterium]
MNNFRFTKIIASVSPILAKETVLSKIINMVDAFSITLSRGFDDNNKKYIDTLMKLDNSKTIILETKGNNVRVKNTTDIPVKKNQTITIDYSEYTQESDKKIYIDYAHLDKVPLGSEIVFEQSEVVLRVEEKKEDYAECKVLSAATGQIFQYDRVSLEHHEEEISTISEQDKKDILRGIEYGTHILAVSAAYSAQHIKDMRSFLQDHNKAEMKIFAKIETQHGLEHLDEIMQAAEGIILVADMINPWLSEKSLEDCIARIRGKGIPVLVSYIKGGRNKNYALKQDQILQTLCKTGVDGLNLGTMIVEDDVFDTISVLETALEKYELQVAEKDLKRFDEADFEVRDYIIYNAYRITKELNIKAIVCFTENGYTSARIASLNPSVPVITFTKGNDTYRFLNVIRGVKGYKISQSFNYENLKRIGKEMIRIIFKGNISLDDKILIVQANESNSEVKSDMINGVELYNFKNI